MPSHVPNVQEPFAKPYATRAERAAYAAGLRALADWAESTEFPIPAYLFKREPFYFTDTTLDINSVNMDDESFVKRPGSAARLIGGMVQKGVIEYSTDYALVRDFGGGVCVRFRISRNAVCTPREEPTIEVIDVPVDEARAQRLEAEQERIQAELLALETVAITKPTTRVVYDCPEALLPREREAELEPEPVNAETESISF